MIKSITARLQDYFGISRKEARGAFVLILVSLIVVWTPFIFRRWVLPLFPQTSPSKAQIDSALKLISENTADAKRYDHVRSKFKKPAIKHFRFDPNVAPVQTLDSAGIPAFLSKRIEKFRKSGGRFRRKEDLLRIYDFPPELYRELERYIVLPEEKSLEKENAFTRSYPKTNNAKSFSAQKQIAVFDINNADTTQLIRLRGIGSKLALRIIKFRDALGGFYSKSQFPEVFGLDSLALSELGKFTKIETPVRKIRINTVSAADLSSHAYFRNRRMVSVILDYRYQHGAFAHADDLLKTKVIDDVLLKKIAPYLSFE